MSSLFGCGSSFTSLDALFRSFLGVLLSSTFGSCHGWDVRVDAYLPIHRFGCTSTRLLVVGPRPRLCSVWRTPFRPLLLQAISPHGAPSVVLWVALILVASPSRAFVVGWSERPQCSPSPATSFRLCCSLGRRRAAPFFPATGTLSLSAYLPVAFAPCALVRTSFRWLVLHIWDFFLLRFVPVAGWFCFPPSSCCGGARCTSMRCGRRFIPVPVHLMVRARFPPSTGAFGASVYC